MERIAGMSLRLTALGRAPLQTKQFIKCTAWSKNFSHLQQSQRLSQQNGCLKLQSIYLSPQAKTFILQDSCLLHNGRYRQYNSCVRRIIQSSSVSSEFKLNGKRLYSSGNKEADPEELIQMKEKFVKDKANFIETTHGRFADVESDFKMNADIEDAAKVLSSDDIEDGDADKTELDKNGNVTVHVNDTDVQFELDTDSDDKIDLVNQPSVMVSDFESKMALDDDTMASNLKEKKAGDKVPAYDGIESSDSDGEVTSDLHSDSDSDSSSSSSDSDDFPDTTDDESDIGPRLPTEPSAKAKVTSSVDDIMNLRKEGFTSEEMIDHIENTSSVDDIMNLRKEGFTSEEMIEHIENSTHKDNDDAGDIEDLLSDNDDELIDEEDMIIESDEDFVDDDEELIGDEEIDRNYEDMDDLADKYADVDTSNAINEVDNNSDRSVISPPSRHFDESGVISFIDSSANTKQNSRDWSVEEIEDFVNITSEDVEELPWQPPVSLQRGQEGVFDIQEIVTLMKNENIEDIVTLKIPKEKQFGDYMVIGTAKSFRHIRASSQNINWIYKQRKSESEKFVKQEGKDQDDGWMALDLGNIILHIFLEEERKLYDLETLWSVGSKYDEKCQELDDPYALSYDDHPWLKDLEDEKNMRDQQ